MAQDELIDSHVSLVQCTRAVDALVAHESKAEEARNENELLPGKEQNVWLVVTVKKMAPTHKIKPVKIPIKHPIVDPRTTPICLITKDPQREYKDLLEEKGIKFISRVVGISKLKGKFKPYEARRMLLKENGMFLADDRIIPILPKLLGSKWFHAKKQPIPVSLARKDLKGELERAISSTYMHQNQGTCTSIKVGALSQKPTQVLANIKTALPAVISAIKDGWDNIQSLHIKTNSSVSLPIWSCSLDDESGGRWDGLIADAEALSEGEVDGSEDGGSDAEVAEEVQDKGKKGKKRVAAEVVDTPKKKAKGSEGQSVSTTSPPKAISKGKTSKTADKITASPSVAPAPSSNSKKAKQHASSPASAPTKSSKPAKDKVAEPAPTPLTSNANSVKPKSQPEKSPKPSKKTTTPIPPKSSSIKPEDLKKKRLAEAIVKKKGKTIALKGSKSVKAALLRKKVAKS
ncbi:ribosomal protein L1 [Pleurotus eryngii]|uniref:Ribosomal L1 domain-containing protein 1 n=1 Tax=Pleurotus eryngii TaxID=5323 RepID=A0A9P6A4G2_PLEER|nr:ribosomal protein L1 [Pleurotus eryngii]